MRWLRANAAKYNLDPEHFGLWGSSAGGHLVALTGTSGGSKEFEPIGGNVDVSDRVQAVLDLYGPTDLLKMNEQSGGRGSIKHDDAKSPESHLIGWPVQENKEKAERANPIKYITKECPPFFIMHGENDDMVPVGQSEILLDALKKQGIDATLVKVPRAGHGDPRFEQGDNLKTIQAFFDKYLKKGGTAADAGARGTSTKQPDLDNTKKADASAANARAGGQNQPGNPDRPQSPGNDPRRPNGQPNQPQRPGGMAGPGQPGGPRAPQMPNGVKVERDLAYAGDDDRRHKLDLYLPEKADKPLPLIIWIYGGGWAMGSKEGGSPAIQFAADGYAVACINHRLSNQAKFPAQIQDCKAAVRWLRANAAKYNLDPNRFATWGGSSGGHLATLTGTSGGSKEFEIIGGNAEISDCVQAVVDWFGPTDLLKMDEQAGEHSALKHNDAQSPEGKLIGGPIQDNKEKAERANPIKYIAMDCPPFLIMHGDADHTVPIGQSELLLEALKKLGIDATLTKVRGGHGGPAFEAPDNIKAIKAFLNKHLKNVAAEAESAARPSNAKGPDAEKAKGDNGDAGNLRIGERKADGPGNGPRRQDGLLVPPRQPGGGMNLPQGGPPAMYWLPEGVTTVRVIVLGREFLRPVPNEEWQAFAKKYSVGIASGIDALPAMARETKHPEIETAPIVTTGVSAGGTAATQIALSHADRVLAVIPIHGAMLAKGNDAFNINRRADTPGDIQTLDVEKLLKVPMVFTYDDADGFVSPVTIEGFMRYGRAKGAPWMLLISKGGNHTESTADFSKVLLPWLGAVMESRLPAQAPAGIAELNESSGWLGDLRSIEIASAADFKGDKSNANWFPNEASAKAWKSHAIAPTYTIPDQTPKESAGVIANFEVNDKRNTDVTTGKGWRINANFKESDQICNNLRFFVAGPVPKILEGCDWIRTMNGGKETPAITADPPFSFTVTADCTVYIAHGDQMQGKVAWLAEWTDTEQTLNVCDGALERFLPMRVYAKKFKKGEKVAPGANSSQRPHGPMYIVLVRKDG